MGNRHTQTLLMGTQKTTTPTEGSLGTSSKTTHACATLIKLSHSYIYPEHMPPTVYKTQGYSLQHHLTVRYEKLPKYTKMEDRVYKLVCTQEKK